MTEMFHNTWDVQFRMPTKALMPQNILMEHPRVTNYDQNVFSALLVIQPADWRLESWSVR